MTLASAAIIIDNRVENIASVDIDASRAIRGWEPEQGIALVLPDGSPVCIGWSYDPLTGTYTPPEED